MKIKFLNQGTFAYRMFPFIKSIIKYGHVVDGSFDYRFTDDYAMVIIEYIGDINTGQKRIAQEFFNSLEEEFINFKGKIIVFSMDDHSSSLYEKLSPAVLNRIDAWIIHAFTQNGVFRTEHICPQILEKYVQVPMFNSYPVTEHAVSSKENKMYFLGTLGTNSATRLALMRKIKRNEFLRNNFVGGLVVEAEIHDNELSDFFRYERIPLETFHHELAKYSIGLCIPGNSPWGHRQIDAMGNRSCVISGNLDLGVDFLYKPQIQEWIYSFDDSKNDFERVCEYALTHTEETKERAEKLYAIYREHLALNPDGSYQIHNWLPIQTKLSSLGVHFQ